MLSSDLPEDFPEKAAPPCDVTLVNARHLLGNPHAGFTAICEIEGEPDDSLAALTRNRPNVPCDVPIQPGKMIDDDRFVLLSALSSSGGSAEQGVIESFGVLPD